METLILTPEIFISVGFILLSFYLIFWVFRFLVSLFK